MIGVLVWAAIDIQFAFWIGLTQIQRELLSWCNVFAGSDVEESEEHYD